MTKHADYIDGDTSTGNRIAAAWLNDINNSVYSGIGDGTSAPTTPAQVRTNLDVTSATVQAGATGASLIGIENSDTGASLETVAKKLAGVISVRDFGALGNDDGLGNGHDDSDNIQAAINAACLAAPPVTLPNTSPYNGRVSSVYFPTGAYRVTKTITIPGSIRLYGSGGNSYTGSRIRQYTANTPLFKLTADTDGISNACTFEELTLRFGDGGGHSSGCLITGAADLSITSLRIKNCTFQNPDYYSIFIRKGDDILITGCTFDVSAQGGICIGATGSELVTNVRIVDNDFFDFSHASLPAIKLVTGRDMVIANNTLNHSGVEGGGGTAVIACFVDGSGGTCTNVVIANNTVQQYNKFVSIASNVWNIIGNIAVGASNTTPRAVEFTGGATLSSINISSNIFQGTFTTLGAIDAATSGTGVNLLTITGNNILSGTTATVGINTPVGSHQLISDNSISGFTADQITGYNGAYTPVWKASTTPPTKVNGTLTGRYEVHNKAIVTTISFTLGSSDSIGVGYWLFSLPTSAVSGSTYVGTAIAYDSSASTFYLGSAIVGSGAGDVTIAFPGTSLMGPGATPPGTCVPFAWAAGDTLDITVTYLLP